MTEPSQIEPFGARLRVALDTREPLCVGIDPHAESLAQWGLADDVAGVERFSRTLVEAVAEHVAVIKPQSAFFERHGSRGIAVLETVISQARAAGALVIADVKRGDIGSTAAAYADAYLTPHSPLWADAVTVNPFLGIGALEPFFARALAYGGGVFVLARTSNPEGATIQLAQTSGGSVAETIIDAIATRNAGVTPMGSFGLVVGATIGGPIEGSSGATIEKLRHDLSHVNGPLLAPGLGAQGATPNDLARVFGAALPQVVPAYSREIARKGPEPEQLKAVMHKLAAECRVALVGKL